MLYECAGHMLITCVDRCHSILDSALMVKNASSCSAFVVKVVLPCATVGVHSTAGVFAMKYTRGRLCKRERERAQPTPDQLSSHLRQRAARAC